MFDVRKNFNWKKWAKYLVGLALVGHVVAFALQQVTRERERLVEYEEKCKKCNHQHAARVTPGDARDRQHDEQQTDHGRVDRAKLAITSVMIAMISRMSHGRTYFRVARGPEMYGARYDVDEQRDQQRHGQHLEHRVVGRDEHTPRIDRATRHGLASSSVLSQYVFFGNHRTI